MHGSPMRFLLLLASGLIVSFVFGSCASTDSSAQSRIERRIDATNQNDEVKIGTAHYNGFAKGMEEPWPFGPYSD
jgi:hypothetical protein